MPRSESRYDAQYFDELDTLSWKRSRKALGQFEKQFLELLKANNSDRILDTGCGTGWHIFNYGGDCEYVVGTDISRIALERAAERLKDHKRFENVSLVCADGQRMPFRTLSFNKILCVSLLEHLERPSQFLSEARRVLRENGLIVVGTPNRIDPVCRTLEFMARKTQKRMPLIGHADDTHQRLFTLNALINLLRACGFRLLNVKVQHSLLGMRTLGGDLVVSAVKTVRTR
jgi:ubiquinone/menaquinone biosynthesis C-methylase UbiE